MLFRDTYTNGTPMDPGDAHLYRVLTWVSIGGVALLAALILLLYTLALVG